MMVALSRLILLMPVGDLLKGEIVGLTAEGRTTAKLLQFNRADRIVERQKYLKA
jgi:hypothetical protein